MKVLVVFITYTFMSKSYASKVIKPANQDTNSLLVRNLLSVHLGPHAFQ